MSSSSEPALVAPNISKPRGSPKINHPPRDRIDNILETARARAVGMDSSTGENEANPRVRLQRGRAEEVESSADEETSIVRSASKQGMNYQGTQHKGQRASPSNTSIHRSGRTYDGTEHETAETGEGGGEGEHESWWTRLLSEYGSIELENKGSVARDHLALERTFLAWLRTSLAFASIGIAITQLFRLNTTSAVPGSGNDPYRHLRQMGKPLGATFLGISIVILFVGFHRYFEGQHWIIRGKFPASRGSIALVAAITFALMITSLIVVVVVEPTAFEK